MRETEPRCNWDGAGTETLKSAGKASSGLNLLTFVSRDSCRLQTMTLISREGGVEAGVLVGAQTAGCEMGNEQIRISPQVVLAPRKMGTADRALCKVASRPWRFEVL